MEFDNTSRDVWEEMRAGTPFSPPQRDTGPYKEDFYGSQDTDGIDFKKLIDYIKKYKTDGTLIFDRKDYMRGYNTVHISVKVKPKPVPDHNRYIYKDEKKFQKQAKIYGSLNRRVDYLSPKTGRQLSIDFDLELVSASLRIYYANTNLFRTYLPDKPDTFQIEDKYVAIILETPDLDDFVQLISLVTSDKDIIESVKSEILKKFADKLQSTNDPKILNFIYRNIPQFLYKNLSTILDIDLLERHLLILKNYDEKHWFTDSSGALIKLLSLICSGDSSALFKLFSTNHRLIIEMYEDMDEQSLHEGVYKDNRLIFVSLIYAICLQNGCKDLKINSDLYRIGANYFPDSNYLVSEDNFIYLEQFRTDTRKEELSEETVLDAGDEFGKAIPMRKLYISVDKSISRGRYYHPLELVEFINYDSEDQSVKMVPAIFVKYFADKKEWEDILFCLRIGADILALIIGVLSLGTTSPMFFLLASTDVAFATGDLLVATLEKELQQSPEGRAFLDAWNKIILVGGIATAGPLLVNAAFRTGVRLFNKGTSLNTKNFVRASLMKIILEANIVNFTRGTLKIIDYAEMVVTESRSLFQLSFVKALQNEGVIFLKGVIEGSGKTSKNGLAIAYEGQIIAFGSAKRLRKALEGFKNLKGKELTAALKKFTLGEGIVQFGKSKLSNFALNFRNTLNSADHPGNIAIVEYIGKKGKLELKAFTTLEKEEDWLALGFIDKPHAEEIALKWLKEQKIGGVRQIYSELEPCLHIDHRCNLAIKESFPSAKVSYSFKYPNIPKLMGQAIKERKAILKTLLND